MRDEFLIERHGKSYVLYAGLLEEAHNRGLSSIETELLQVPSPENAEVSIARAVVVMNEPTGGADEDGNPVTVRKEFSGIGDASPKNVGRAIAPHSIRMAETRAKARALRDAVNVGVTSLEELSGDEEGAAVATPIRPQGSKTPQKSENRSQPARKSQVELLRTLAEQLRGENGVARLESRIGKSLTDLTRDEADEWIDRLTPAEGQEA